MLVSRSLSIGTVLYTTHAGRAPAAAGAAGSRAHCPRGSPRSLEKHRFLVQRRPGLQHVRQQAVAVDGELDLVAEDLDQVDELLGLRRRPGRGSYRIRTGGSA